MDHHREFGVQTSQTPTRETSPDCSLRDPSGIVHRHFDPPHRCSRMILPFAVGFGAGAYSVYNVYSKMKEPIEPKRNMTMSVTRNRY